MSFKQKWRITIKDLEINMRVGCDPEERTPQRIIVNATVEGDYSLKPETLEECVDYDLIYQLVAKKWPELPHTILLETRINELLYYIFSKDDRVQYAKVRLEKPDIFKEVKLVGIESEWTRKEYENYTSLMA